MYDGRKVDRRESIPWELMERTLQELAQMKVKAVTLSGGGEPLCYHSIDKMLDLIKQLRIDYSIITNGQALEGEIANGLKEAKWVRVSFDSYRAETYETVRRVSTHSRVMRNIEHFANIKNENCTLGINCVITKQNSQEIYDICRLAKETGADNIKLSPIMVKQNEADYHKQIQDSVMDQIERAKQQLEDGTFRIVDKYTNDLAMNNEYRKQYHYCVIQELFTVIAADSKVYRCHQKAYTKSGEIGDLAKQTFREIWYSQEIADNIRKFDAYEECRFRCAFDERNLLLNDFLNTDSNHVNFI